MRKSINLANLDAIDSTHAKCVSLFQRVEGIISKAQLTSLSSKVSQRRNADVPAITGVSKGRVLK